MKKMHLEDLLKLKSIFGDTLVYDYFSMNDITMDIGKFYKKKHYKPYIAKKIKMN